MDNHTNKPKPKEVPAAAAAAAASGARASSGQEAEAEAEAETETKADDVGAFGGFRGDLNALNGDTYRSLNAGLDYGEDGLPRLGAAELMDSAMAFLAGQGVAHLGLKGHYHDHGSVPPAELEPPMPPGGYLAPSAHVFSNTNPNALLEAAANVTVGFGADCHTAVHLFQASALVYHHEHEVSFLIRVFSSPAPERGRYVLEIRRQEGDAWTFWNLYHAIVAKLAAQALVLPASEAPVLPDIPAFAMERERLQSVADVEVTHAQWEKGMRPLLEMMQSSSIRNQLEGARTLAHLVEVREGAKEALFRLDESFRTLVDAMASKHRNVHRCALSTLATLAEAEASPYPQMLSEDEEAMRSAVNLLRSDILQVKREAARLLLAIGQRGGARLLRPACEHDLETVLRGLTCSPDSRLRWLSESLRACLSG